MATRAFILIETAVGKTRDVANTLGSAQGITSVDVVTGPYDVIAIIEGDDINAIGDLVTGKFHDISGIVRTVTCVAVGS